MHSASQPANTCCTIELTLHNHPGVMVHVANLFARRAFNLEGILCSPLGDGQLSRMLLRVGADSRIDQVLRHLEKLHDVVEVRLRPDLDTRTVGTLFPVPQRPEERLSDVPSTPSSQ